MNWSWVLVTFTISLIARKHPLCEKGHIQGNNGKMGSEPQGRKDECQYMPLLSLQPQFHHPCSRLTGQKLCAGDQLRAMA